MLSTGPVTLRLAESTDRPALCDLVRHHAVAIAEPCGDAGERILGAHPILEPA